MTPKRLGAVAVRQPRCTVCAQVPVAMRGVAFCFGCWPGGPVIPPPCLRCGTTSSYYTSGVCRRCHRDGDPGVDSCLDCYAWGATRNHHWLCHGCFSWRKKNPTIGACAVCRRTVHIGNWGRDVCRLCYKQASLRRHPDGKLDLFGANRNGQQLFIADLFLRRGMRRPRLHRPPQAAPPLPQPVLAAGYEQPALFAARRDLAAHGRSGLHLRADPVQAAQLEQRAQDLGRQLGWNARQVEDTCLGLRIAIGLRDTRDEPVKASDVALLRSIDLPIWTVMRVLREAGLLIEDRTPAFDTWFAQQIADLPTTTAVQLTGWFEIMKHGSPTPPRRKPRTEGTIRTHLAWALPTLHAWAAAGHDSLREITREQVLEALPPSGNPRSQTGQGLKSIFRLLKSRKVLFTDPTLRVKTGEHERREPLPADIDALRAALTSDNPTQAALVALIAFHGLRAGQIPPLLLTDIRDGRLHLDDRIIPLAEPVRQRLRTYLDYRAARWPNSTNPYLFVHYRSASRDEPIGKRWVWLTVGPDLSAAAIRKDRILDEAHASGGDPRRLADLFGLSIDASQHYTATVDNPDLVAKTTR